MRKARGRDMRSAIPGLTHGKCVWFHISHKSADDGSNPTSVDYLKTKSPD